MSITLTTPYTVSVNGTQVEDDTIGAVTSISIDYIGCLLTVVYKIGTLIGSPSTFNAGPYAQLNGKTITVIVYIGPTTASQTYGMWWLNGALQSSIVPSASLTNTISTAISWWNTAESFASVSGGLLPGTQVAWVETSGGTLP